MQVPFDDLVAYYCASIRSSLDYAFPVSTVYALPKYLQAELERVQKTVLKCIYPGVSYKDALSLAGIDSMRAHQEQITNQLFQLVVNNPSNKIYGLLPKKCNRPTYNLRRQKTYTKLKQRDLRTLLSTRVALWHCIHDWQFTF